MAKLECKFCGNKKTWRNIYVQSGQYEAECDECGEVTHGFGGVEVDTIVGRMVFNKRKGN